MKISLCLLTLNEVQGCKMVVPNLTAGSFHEVYAVDGGSKDGTIEYLEEMGVKVFRQKKKGLNPACVEAVEHASGDAVIFFHPKGTIDPAETLKFIPYFKQGYEMIVASRNMKGAQNEEDVSFLRPRKWFVVFISMITSFLWRKSGWRITDTLHGFRGFTIKTWNFMEITNTGVSVDLESNIKSYKYNIPRIEFPTREEKRGYGGTHFAALPTVWELIRHLAKEIKNSLTLKEKIYTPLSKSSCCEQSGENRLS